MYYMKMRDEVVRELESHSAVGLTKKQVEERLIADGYNVLPEEKKTPLMVKIFYQLSDFITIVLLVAAAIAFYTAYVSGEDDYIEGFLIIGIVCVNIIVFLIQERNAERSLSALQQASENQIEVIRDNQSTKLSISELVKGDLIVLQPGMIVPADARLIESVQLRTEESVLTGESAEIDKNAAFAAERELVLGDQINMLFSGSSVVHGRGKAIVTATGKQTEMGKVIDLLVEQKKSLTPLQVRLNKLGRNISIIALIATVIVFTLDYFQGVDILESFLTAVSVAVAAVPETLMVIVMLTLLFGVQKMSRKKAIVRRLPAVETLGTASVICTDKTGTLTKNQMSVRRLWLNRGKILDTALPLTSEGIRLLEFAGLCSDAKLARNDIGKLSVVGSPTEGAVLQMLLDNDLTKEELELRYPRVAELPFDSERRLMSTVHQAGDSYFLVTKGAYEEVAKLVTNGEVDKGVLVNQQMAEQALRIIAVAYKSLPKLPKDLSASSLENELELLGVIGMIDPPREESKSAVKRAKAAGIKTVMITGDHELTARTIARELGIMESDREMMTGSKLAELSDEALAERIEEYSVYARTTPQDKIRIVKAWQKNGDVVAMTGDGINDVPALRIADIGCSMGITGSDVAKSAADLILTDDHYETIVDAVGEGRTVYSNIRKTLNVIMTSDMSEILIVIFPMIIGWGAAVTALQLLFVNLVADGLPGFSLSWEKMEPQTMKQPPIDKGKTIFAGGLWQRIATNNLTMVLITMIGFYLGAFVSLPGTVGPSVEVAQTMTFLIIGYASIVNVFNVRTSRSVFATNHLENMPLVGVVILATVLMTIAVIFPSFRASLGTAQLSVVQWLIVLSLSSLMLIVNEGIKWWLRQRKELLMAMSKG